MKLSLEHSLWSGGTSVKRHGEKANVNPEFDLRAMSSKSRANSNASFTVQRISPIRDMTLCCLQLVKYEDVAHWPASSVFTVRKRSISTNCKASFKADMVEIESALVKSSSVSFRQMSIWLRCLRSSAASGMSSSSPRTSETKFTVDFTKVWASHSTVHWHLKQYSLSKLLYFLWDQWFSPDLWKMQCFLFSTAWHVTHRPLLPTPDPNPSQILEQWEQSFAICWPVDDRNCGMSESRFLWLSHWTVWSWHTQETASVFSCFPRVFFLSPWSPNQLARVKHKGMTETREDCLKSTHLYHIK